MLYNLIIAIIIALPIVIGMLAAYFGGDKVYNSCGRFRGMRPNGDYFFIGVFGVLKIYLWILCIMFFAFILLFLLVRELAKKA